MFYFNHSTIAIIDAAYYMTRIIIAIINIHSNSIANADS